MPDTQILIPTRTIKPLQIFTLVVMFVGVYYFLPQLSELPEVLTLLRHSSWIWLIMGSLVTGINFLIGTAIQFIAGNATGRFKDLIIIEFAGSFVNHFLPFSVGGIGMTAEYYHTHGQSRTKSLITAAVPTVFGIITTILIVITISPISFVQLNHNFTTSRHTTILVTIIGFCVILAAIALTFYKKHVRSTLDEAIKGVRSIHSIRQMIKIIIGSLVQTLLFAFTLYASVHSIGGNVAIVTVIILYITSLLIGDITPTPGGIGATEATLVFGLSSAGLSLEQAIASTVIFRFMTFWLPLIPGLIAVRKLNQKRINRKIVSK